MNIESDKKMVYLFKSLVFIVIILLPSSLGAYNDEDLEEITTGTKFMLFADLCFASLNNENLDKVDLNSAWIIDASFRESSLKKASLVGVYAKAASFRWANLEGADLKKGNFTGAYFYGANLKKVKAIDANFKDVTGLTNKQKAYLRKAGAKNVPKNLSAEEFEAERLLVEEKLRNHLMEYLEKMWNSITSCFRRQVEA